MIKIKQTVIVEGKYDKIKLSSLLDAVIVETNGFQIFKDREKLEFIRLMAERTGILILTDSDRAGFQIRNYLKGTISDPDHTKVKHAYIPEILGKEKRKSSPSKAGTLGVEGVSSAVLLKALRQAGVLCAETQGENTGEKLQEITKMDLFEDGLSGREDSFARRQTFLAALGLPGHLSANALPSVLNTMMSYAEYRAHIEKLFY